MPRTHMSEPHDRPEDRPRRSEGDRGATSVRAGAVDDHPVSLKAARPRHQPARAPCPDVIRTIVQLDDDQWVAAREQARLEGLSLAAFVRRAVDARLATRRIGPRRDHAAGTGGDRRLSEVGRAAGRGWAGRSTTTRMSRPIDTTRVQVRSLATGSMSHVDGTDSTTSATRSGDTMTRRSRAMTALIDTTALLALLDGRHPQHQLLRDELAFELEVEAEVASHQLRGARDLRRRAPPPRVRAR